jgi:hypothetical protein
MGTPYTVVAGDYLVKIAADHGYESWRDIYYHPDNEDFRRKRPNPDKIYPGDVLILPDLSGGGGDPGGGGTPPGGGGTPPGGDGPPGGQPPDTQPNKSLFNFFWLYPLPEGLDDLLSVARTELNVVCSPDRGIQAVILYPALVVPAIVVGEEPIEFLVLTDGATLTLQHLNQQLKFSVGFDTMRSYVPGPLFRGKLDENIKVEPISFGNAVTDTHERMSCLFDSRALKLYGDWGFTSLYRVRVASSCLFDPPGVPTPFNRMENGVVVPQEIQDGVMWETLAPQSGEDGLNGPHIAARGLYAFQLDGDRVDLTQIDKQSPIQAYHPVFHYRQLGYASLGHLSDLHMSARQNLLAESTARVIEYQEPGATGLADADLDVSPYIGGQVNVSSRTVQRILQGLGRPEQPDILIIGGDLIDYIKSWYPADRSVMDNPSVRQIWDQVSLADGYDTRHYQDFVDFITMYTLIVNFYRSWKKPVFVVSGNHDCYYMTYGISPRVRLINQDLKLANEGIPADHNLTIYEAILAFGDTFGEMHKSHFLTLFEESLFLWFYTVLAPISDFVVHLPRQSIIALGWGDDENMFDAPLFGQGFGHLPRAKLALTEAQYGVVQRAVTKGRQDPQRRLVLTSHFTFISYLGAGPYFEWKDDRWVRPEGDVYVGSNYDKYDEGTFENYRRELYYDLLADKKIHCVLTGHSHHRGMHAILRKDTYGRDSVDTRLYGFEWLSDMKADGVDVPAVIISDSAGPIPRFNFVGEFEKWGSARASGTVVVFGDDGGIAQVRALPVNPRPRFPVVADYVDTYAWGDPFTGRWLSHVVDTFRSDEFPESDEARGRIQSYAFTIRLHELFRRWVWLAGVRIYLTWPEEGVWGRAVFTPTAGNDSRWMLSGVDASWFRYIASVQSGRRTFMALKFAPVDPGSMVTAEYDFDAWWTTECQIETGGTWVTNLFSSTKCYVVSRNRRRGMDPDLDWRASMGNYPTLGKYR